MRRSKRSAVWAAATTVAVGALDHHVAGRRLIQPGRQDRDPEVRGATVVDDGVHFSWFARQSPSIAEQGYYTYLNNFAHVAGGC